MDIFVIMNIGDNMNNKRYCCPSCGYPTTEEKCYYCNSEPAISSQYANLNYPIVECKEANLSPFLYSEYIKLGVCFTIIIILFLIICFLVKEDNYGAILFFAIFFGIVPVMCAHTIIKHKKRYDIVKENGKEIEGIVCGYLYDRVKVRHRYLKIAKILINKDTDPKYIMYHLGTKYCPYPINSTIILLSYENLYSILDK